MNAKQKYTVKCDDCRGEGLSDCVHEYLPGKHTPGPWHNNGGFIIADSGADVASTPKHNVKVDRLDQHRADATLIAAAPELLNLLKRAVAHDSCDAQCENAQFGNCFHKLAKEAIAKAEGRA